MWIKVVDIKQYCYCPRIIYFTYVMPVVRKTTPAMKYGKDAHAILDRLEKRRTLKRYHLEGGHRVFHAELESPLLMLRGKLDLHIVTAVGQLYPVEIKDSPERLYLAHRLQLVAYSMLLAETTGKPVEKGFLYYLPADRIFTVSIDAATKGKVQDAITAIRQIIKKESMPMAANSRAKCLECEYRNFCGDVT